MCVDDWEVRIDSSTQIIRENKKYYLSVRSHRVIISVIIVLEILTDDEYIIKFRDGTNIQLNPTSESVVDDC